MFEFLKKLKPTTTLQVPKPPEADSAPGIPQSPEPNAAQQEIPDIVLTKFDQNLAPPSQLPRMPAPGLEFPDIRLPKVEEHLSEQPNQEIAQEGTSDLFEQPPQPPLPQEPMQQQAPADPPATAPPDLSQEDEFILPDFEESVPAVTVTAASIPSFPAQNQPAEKLEPLFIRAGDYLRLTGMKKGLSQDLASVFEKSELLVKLNQDCTAKLEKWYSTLNDVQEKLIAIDKKLFEEAKP